MNRLRARPTFGRVVLCLCLAWVAPWTGMGCGGAGDSSSSGDGSDVESPDVNGDGTLFDVGPRVDVPSSDLDGSDPADTGTEPWVHSPCSLETRVGGFEVTLADEFTGITGLVHGGVVPSHVPELISEIGGCRVLKARSLFCDPACVPGETCGEEGACIPHPEALSVGVVTITGMKSNHSIEAKWGNHYTNSGSLEHPGFVSGAEIALSAAGEDAEGFDLVGHGVEKLEVPSGGGKVQVEEGEGLDLIWSPGSPHDGVRVHVELNINNHGAGGAFIACEVPDTGGHTIDQALMTELQSFGVSGFPSLVLTRQSADSVDLTIGCVEFLVSSERVIAVEVDGVTSCTSNNQCPPGQSCGADLQCS